MWSKPEPSKNGLVMQDTAPKLQLMARNGDDIVVLSALLQDAIIPGADMAFDRKIDEFVIVANRFCWELGPAYGVKSSDGKTVHERRLCGIRIGHVRAVRHYNWPKIRQNNLFNLLALRHVDMEEQNGDGAVLQFDFSGGSSLRLNVIEIDIVLADLGTGHPTCLRPGHKF